MPRRLRSSTAVSESKPCSLKERSTSTGCSDACPSTAATWPRTSSTSRRSRSARFSPANLSTREPASRVPAEVSAVRRLGAVRTSPLSTAGTVSAPRSPARSSRAGTRAGSAVAKARSSKASPSADGSGARPVRLSRCRSARPSSPVIALACSHSPHASEVAVRPSARRRCARASRKAFAAA